MQFLALSPNFIRTHYKRVLVTWLVSVLSIVAIMYLFAGVSIQEKLIEIVIFAAVLGLLNAILRPIVVYFSLPFTMITFGLFSLLIDGAIMWLAVRFVFDNAISLGDAVWFALLLAVINAVLASILSLKDEDSYYYSVVRNLATKHAAKNKTDQPGYLFVEIDGLAKEVLEKALSLHLMPNLSKLLASTHTLTGWETDYASQTCTSQAGLLLGNNHNVVAFRWHDKNNGHYFTASSMPMLGKLQKKLAPKGGLLAPDGVSISNMFSGNAERAILTTAAAGKPASPNPLYYYFVNPYNYGRSLLLSIATIFREVRDGRRQKQENPPWATHRGLEFGLMRAFMSVLVPDMAMQSAYGEVLAGTRAVYVTIPAYDELAHFTGILSPESLAGLRDIDEHFGRLTNTILAHAPRPYHLIVLSDHGQTQGPNFVKAYGHDLGEVVKQGLPDDQEVTMIAGVSEGKVVFNSLIAEIVGGVSQKLKRTKKSSAKSIEQNVEKLSVNTETINAKPTKQVFGSRGEVLVLGSGNAGLVYFSKDKTRLTQEELQKRYPKLIDAVVTHPGVGFLMVRSKKNGAVAIGKRGSIVLKTGKVTGTNPLKNYGKNAIRHLLRVDSFDTCPDILINATYDPKTGFSHSLEPQAGFHGGLGGPQNFPFLIYPKQLGKVKGELIGAEAVHRQLLSWMKTN